MDEIDELLAYKPDNLAWPVPADILKKLSRDDATHYLKARKLRIDRSEKDPLRYGYTPPIWDTVDEHIADLRQKFPNSVVKIIIWGGHRSSKTRKASNLVLRDIKENEGRLWWCCDASEAISRANQMKLLWEQFPPEWKALERDVVTDIRYNFSDGFPKNLFVAPNKSKVEFKFHRTMDIANLPGPELNGVWCFVAGTKISIPGGETPIENIQTGDLICTRKGYSRAIVRGKRKAAVGRVLFSNGVELVGTADHPVLTKLYGWTRLSDLKLGDRVCVINALSGMENDGTRTEGATWNIAEREASIELIGINSIGRFGVHYMAIFRRVSTFITETATSLTTILKTSCAYLVQTTCGIITRSVAALSELIGIRSRSSNCDAWTAEYSLLGNCGQGILAVNLVIPEEQNENAKHSASVDIAEKSSEVERATFVARVVSTWEHVGEDTVYNLKVEDTPEYFANGILVHNSDELIPLPWVHVLNFRLTNRNGLFLITFCPEFGWNETIQYFYEGSQIISESDAPLLPKYDAKGNQIGFKKVPRVMQCADPSARIIFFHTADNPFSNYPTLVHELKDKSEDEILIRAYGICTKAHRVAFPMFNRHAHVITEASFNRIVEEYPNGVRYHLVDPCDGRNWAQTWIFCPSLDRWIIYKEWPSYGHPKAYIKGVGILGPWAVSGAAADGVRGPAQDTLGFSLERYAEEIEDKETDENGVREEIFARYIDSRYATQRKTERETVTTLQEQCAEVGMDFLCMVAESKILGARDGSIDMINSSLFYDLETDLGKFSPSLGRLNHPKLQVVETCPNTIWALEHFTGEDGQRGACKDFVDTIRGAFLSQVNYMDESLNVFVGGGLPSR